MLLRTLKNDEHALAFEIRKTVFIEEQNVPEEEEYDGLDETSTLILGWVRGQAVATGRLRFLPELAKIERVAVLKEYRGLGLGAALTRYMMHLAQKKGVTTIKLNSQCEAIGFYEKLGFTARGEVFLDAGIPHREMVFQA